MLISSATPQTDKDFQDPYLETKVLPPRWEMQNPSAKRIDAETRPDFMLKALSNVLDMKMPHPSQEVYVKSREWHKTTVQTPRRLIPGLHLRLMQGIIPRDAQPSDNSHGEVICSARHTPIAAWVEFRVMQTIPRIKSDPSSRNRDEARRCEHSLSP
ncbi:hypothetical protein CERZMDRAFT_99162 [Cercospora zeae-maydis SCOH1-5]|uniref:Uncharacterized protein n=1 Tax=Cercospora zeae-maydis SCOH1-5 TaxID=717836 RepID=A0A6A6FAU3_9PEZI|nr:hypothetical protein CERZMDRAFT_99162 [Cercospora zeae-maydis SCOH1-5]